MSLKGKKVLITGGSGFIGSHLVQQLLTEGCLVTVLVRPSSLGYAGWIDTFSPAEKEQLKIIRGDIRDSWTVLEAAKGQQIIFHLAALISIPYSYSVPEAYVDTNIKGTLNVLQSARVQGVEKTVITSTSEVYGTALSVPITEDHPLQGQSPYSASKIGADQLALSFWRSYGLPVTVIRPFNCYGPRQSTRAIIPTIIIQALKNNGNIRLGSLKPTRDFTFVTDTARAFKLIAESKEAVGKVINIGNGFDVSIGELVEKIGKVMGKQLKVQTDDQRLRPEKSEVFQLVSSTKLAQSVLNWKASTSLDVGLKEAAAWFSNAENLKFYPDIEYRI